MRWLLSVALAASSPIATVHAQSLPPQELSVMLTFKDKAGTNLDECAAGIVIAQNAGRTLILTAYHVLGLAPGEAFNGRQVQVEFRQVRGKRYAARVLDGPGFQDSSLDYLLIAVDGAPEVPRDAFSTLAASDEDETSAVRIVGAPDCRPWDPDPVFHPVTSVGKFEIEFESAVTGGASGGAAFDQANALVAMVDESDGRRARARPIALILDRLRQSGIAHDLRSSPGASGETARASSEAPPRPESVVAKPGPVINPNRFTGSLASVSDRETSFQLHPPENLKGKIDRYESALGGYRKQAGSDFDDYVFSFPNGTAPRLSPPIRIVFSNGERSEPFVLPLKALYDDEVRKTFAKLDWIKCERQAKIYCRSSQIPQLPLVSVVRLGTSPTDQPLALSCRATCDMRGGPPYLVRSADFPASAERVFAQIELTDGTVFKAIELPVEDKRQCRAIECPPETIAARSLAPNQPPAMLQANISVVYGANYGIELPDTFHDAAMEIDPDGRGFLPARSGRVPWGRTQVSVRFRTDGGLIGPFRYEVPEAELIKTNLPRPPENDVIFCLRGSCWVKEPIWLASTKTLEIGSTPDRLSKMALPDLRAKVLDTDYRTKLLNCSGLWNEGCETFRQELGIVFKPAPNQSDVYYRLETYNGAKTGIVRQRLP